ncbi:MAG: alpha/beta fold hydrolase [Oceanisphaera sp.]|uniref:alpha/beta fold hydrolase n=1 Tax=Oceanisphaera sp. TaxID=1929979 RepID=UPI003F9CA149
MSKVLINGASDAPNRVLFAHGAGAGMEHADINFFAQALADEQIQVIRFEFPYMQKTRSDGRRRPPDREPVLLDYWREIVAEFAHSRLFLAGKSMGGRMASLVADELTPTGLILLGFPFTPPNKPEKYRGAHLATLTTPTLLVQGERDAFGNKDAVQRVELSQYIQTHWLTDGDHSFKPRKASGTTLEQNLHEAVVKMRSFILAG